ATLDRGRHHVGAWSFSLLNAVVWGARVTGLDSPGAPAYYQTRGRVSSPVPCDCGGAMTGQTYVSPAGNLRRVFYQCGVCGGVNDCPPDGGLSVSGERRVARGDRLRWTCDIAPPEEA